MGVREKREEMKKIKSMANESTVDNAKFLSEFLFLVVTSNRSRPLLHNIMRAYKYNQQFINCYNTRLCRATQHQKSPHIRFRCSAPRKDHLVYNLVIRQSLIRSNGLPIV